MIKLYTVKTKKLLGVSTALLIAVCSFFIASVPQTAQAQVVNENFDAGLTLPNLPFGWITRKLSGNTPNANEFSTVSTSTLPNASAHTASNFVKYSGYAATATEDAILVSPAYDFRNGVGSVSFQFYHSTTGATGDYIEVYYNSVPVFAGATLIAGSNTPRNNGSTGWALKTFSLPQIANCRTYIIIRAVSGATNSGNMYFDSFTITTNAQNMSYTGFGAAQNANPVGLGQTNQDILKLMIITCGAATPISLNQLNFNTNGTTNLAYISNARVYYTKGNKNYTPNDVNNILFGGQTIGTPGTNMTFNGPQVLENDTNYFWLTYNISSLAAAAGNYVDGDWLDFTLSGATGQVITNQAPAGARLIAQNYCIPAYGCGTCWPGDFIQDVQTYNGVSGVNIVNNNSGANPSPPYYTFYPPTTNPPRTATLQQAQQYQLRTRVGTYPNGNNIVAWIDFDGNGYFSENERIYEAYHANGNAYLGGLGQATDNFWVPSLGGGTDPSFWGPRRMRVREMWITNSGVAPTLKTNSNYSWGAPFPTTTPTGRIHPCNYYSYGETEDYIVTIIPNCFPGEWLGFTNDWDDPQNWCDGVPTPTTNVTIPTAPKGGKWPHLFDGTLATCNNILFQPGSFMFIESPKAGNFQVYGTLTNHGTIEVLTNFDNNFVLGSGALSSVAGAFTTPFHGQINDQRTQMRYMASELLAKGFTAGDAISTVGLQTAGSGPLNAFNPGQQFLNFNVTMGHTTNANNWVFAPPNNTSQGWFGFSGATSTYSVASIQPPLNSTLNFPLSQPFIWNGTNDILVEMCFDNPQGGAARTNGVLVMFTQTTGVPSFKTTHYNGTTLTDGCAIGSPANGTTNYNGNVLDRRANLIVEGYSPNGIYPIHVRGDWINNGTFIAGRSNVIFDGSAAIQNIAGTNLTTFSRMTVQKTGVVRMNRTTEIDSSLYLGAGVLELNSYTITLKNPNINPSPPTVTNLTNLYALPVVPAWARNTGFVRAETMPSTGVGYIQWNIGNVTVSTPPAVYQFPFGTGAQGASTGAYVPIDIDYYVNNTNLGNMKVTTYATPPNNLEMPPTVTHINGLVASPNDPNMIDRYWIMEKTGAATSGAGFKIRWIAGELAVNNVAPYATQRWYGGNWPFNGIGTQSGNMITVTDADLNAYTPAGWIAANYWAAAGFATPLPIELLTFDAQLRGKEVHLNWSTASEKDNDFFTIEKTQDANEYMFVTKVPSKYNNSNFVVDYKAIDPEPIRGLSYYRLGQTDYDGTTTYSNLVPVAYSFNDFDIVYAVNNDNNIVVAFGYDYDEPVSYHVTDNLGRVLVREEFPEVVTGGNMLTIDGSNLRDGIYFITIYNSQKSVSQKIFFSKQ